MYLIGLSPSDGGKKSLFALMRLASTHTCTENDSIKEALRRVSLTVNYVTIRFDGRQPGRLIGMRTLAMSQNLDLPERRQGSDTTHGGTMTMFRHVGPCGATPRDNLPM